MSDKQGRTGPWFNYKRTQVDFSTCGIIVAGGTAEYAKGKLSSESLEKCIVDAPKAFELMYMLLFSHAVDNFQSYLSDLLHHILEHYPKAMFGKKIDAKVLYEVPDLDSLKRRAVDKYVMDLGYKNAGELAEFLKDNFGLVTLSHSLTKLRLNRAIQIRNIIAHNRGIVNDVFIFRSGSKVDRVGDKVKTIHPLVISGYLAQLVDKLDVEARKKFDLPLGTYNG